MKLQRRKKFSDLPQHIFLKIVTRTLNSYKLSIYGKGQDKYSSSELSVDMSDLDDTELLLKHNFIEWDNSKKNNAKFIFLKYIAYRKH